MPRASFAIALACGLSAAFPAARAQVHCTPHTNPVKQERVQMKHRPAVPKAQIDSLAHTTVDDMLKWPVPPITTTPVRTQQTPIEPQEHKLFQLTADAWLVKLADDDCDYHLEVTAPGGSANDPRVIVEIPQGPAYAEAAKALVQALHAQGTEIKTAGTPHLLKQPLRIIVKGYTFLDASHFDPNEPHKGHAHGSSLVGTLWEIHPVLELVALASMQPARPHADAKPPAKANGEKAKAADKPKHGEGAHHKND